MVHFYLTIYSTMTVEVIETIDFHGFKAVIPKVTGSAHFVSENMFCFDPKDPYNEGFIFR